MVREAVFVQRSAIALDLDDFPRRSKTQSAQSTAVVGPATVVAGSVRLVVINELLIAGNPRNGRDVVRVLGESELS
jgi:hypothetical protein